MVALGGSEKEWLSAHDSLQAFRLLFASTYIPHRSVAEPIGKETFS